MGGRLHGRDHRNFWSGCIHSLAAYPLNEAQGCGMELPRNHGAYVSAISVPASMPRVLIGASWMEWKERGAMQRDGRAREGRL